MTDRIYYTRLPRLRDIDATERVSEDWAAFTRRFSTHLEFATKDAAPGFGPYVLRAPSPPCAKHRGGLRAAPHRCDACVSYLTLAVFDADAGTAASVEACRAKLNADGQAALWYTTYSWAPGGQESWRLVLPLAESVTPERWPAVRLGLARKFAIPADLKTCGGASHFYFAPSCAPGAERRVVVQRGGPAAVGGYDDVAAPVRATTLEYRRRFADADFEPPPEPDSPPELGPFIVRLEARRKSLRRKQPAKADLLRRVLDGAALAEPGHRNAAMLSVTGVLAFALPDAPVSVLLRILEPSIAAMQDERSAGLAADLDRAERMLLSAMRNKHIKDLADAAEAADVRAALEQRREQAVVDRARAIAEKQRYEQRMAEYLNEQER